MSGEDCEQRFDLAQRRLAHDGVVQHDPDRARPCCDGCQALPQLIQARSRFRATAPVDAHWQLHDVEEITLPGMPLGARADFAYGEREIELEPGDTLLLMSDGFPELANPRGEILGYERARGVFAHSARRPAGEIVAALAQAASDWAGSSSPSDDVTFLVVRAL